MKRFKHESFVRRQTLNYSVQVQIADEIRKTVVNEIISDYERNIYESYFNCEYSSSMQRLPDWVCVVNLK
jgi:hypothetical protein